MGDRMSSGSKLTGNLKATISCGAASFVYDVIARIDAQHVPEEFLGRSLSRRLTPSLLHLRLSRDEIYELSEQRWVLAVEVSERLTQLAHGDCA